MTRPTIYEAAGGAPAMHALAAAHHARCLAHPVLGHPFQHGTKPDHVERLAAYWTEVLGGPPTFTESYGGHSGMLSIHANQGMGPELGEAFVECFAAAADDAHLPDDPELRGALHAYMQWAVAEVESYNPPEARVSPALPVPKWTWTGLALV
jgi:hemoglobin